MSETELGKNIIKILESDASKIISLLEDLNIKPEEVVSAIEDSGVKSYIQDNNDEAKIYTRLVKLSEMAHDFHEQERFMTPISYYGTMDWHDNLIDDDESIHRILKASQVIAVVGIKDEKRAQEAAHAIPAYLYSRGYSIIPVNPSIDSVFGIPSLCSLLEISQPVDIVLVFRAPKHVMRHALEALKLKPRPGVFWMPNGVMVQKAAYRLARAGIKVIQDRDIYTELKYSVLTESKSA